MAKKYLNIINVLYPTIDVHGEFRDTVGLVVNDFIHENYCLGKEKVVIIHGIGKHILAFEIHNILPKNKEVKNFYYDHDNIGQTIVELIENTSK